MTFVWMRRIDTVFGGGLAALVGLFTRSPRSFAGDLPPPELPPRRVVCAQFFGLGSVALSLPLLKRLKDSGARIAFCSFPGQAEIVRLSGLVDEIWVIKPTLSGFLPSFLRTFFLARRFRAEAFLDLEGKFYLSAVLGRLTGAHRRCGFLSFRPRRDRLYSHLVSLERERHIVEAYHDFCQMIGVGKPSTDSARSVEMLPLPSFQGVENVIPRFNGRKRVVININASDTAWQRQWPLESWVQLCDRLLEDRSIDLIFPGGFDDQVRNQELISKLKDQTRVFNIAGTVSLLELLRILSEADLLVSVSSGIIHLAAWCGTPIVALLGPDFPKVLSPLSKNATALWMSLPCSPCFGLTPERGVACRDNLCMRRIDVETVYRMGRRYLELGREAARAA